MIINQTNWFQHSSTKKHLLSILLSGPSSTFKAKFHLCSLWLLSSCFPSSKLTHTHTPTEHNCFYNLLVSLFACAWRDVYLFTIRETCQNPVCFDHFSSFIPFFYLLSMSGLHKKKPAGRILFCFIYFG